MKRFCSRREFSKEEEVQYILSGFVMLIDYSQASILQRLRLGNERFSQFHIERYFVMKIYALRLIAL